MIIVLSSRLMSPMYVNLTYNLQNGWNEYVLKKYIALTLMSIVSRHPNEPIIRLNGDIHVDDRLFTPHVSYPMNNDKYGNCSIYVLNRK